MGFTLLLERSTEEYWKMGKWQLTMVISRMYNLSYIRIFLMKFVLTISQPENGLMSVHVYSLPFVASSVGLHALEIVAHIMFRHSEKGGHRSI